MKKVMGVMAGCLMLAAGSANAAGNWAGPYAGGSLGLTSFSADIRDHYEYDLYTQPNYVEQGVTVTVQGGYNWQLDNNFVVGAELDFSTGVDSSNTLTNSSSVYQANSEWKSLISLRVRAGLAVDKTLVYVTGGLAQADAENSFVAVSGNDNATSSNDLQGTVVGVGVEHMLNDNLTFRLEYLNTAMERDRACWADTTTGACWTPLSDYYSVSWTTSQTSLRAGANWKF